MKKTNIPSFCENPSSPRTCTANCSDADKVPIVPKKHRHGKQIREQLIPFNQSLG